MSTKGTLTREQAIQAVGAELVEKLDSVNCDFTGRQQTDGDDTVEFSASIQVPENDERYTTLIAYYYQPSQDIEDVEDLSNLRWTVAGYELI